jgi:2-phospho-L-lactate guanylyltransferase
MHPTRRWWVIVPLKPAAVGKSRLRPIPASHVRALGRATVRAALGARSVAGVLVVTAERRDRPLRDRRVSVVRESEVRGLGVAIARGLRAVRGRPPVAVLVGDLPGLIPDDLDAALALALRHPRAFVRDADGTGTTLVTTRAGVPLRARFGAGSAARHLALGLIELEVPADSSLRRDIDTPDQLAAL